jgi:hypothetical protein
MKKFKVSIVGFQKRSVEELLKGLELEHIQKKQNLENELKGILADIQRLK